MSERNGKLVGALVGGIRIMRYLNAATEPVGVNRVARDLALNPSTAYNLLRTLVYERLAVFDPERKTYAPGPGLADLGAGMQDFTAHIRLVRAHLRDLAARNDVTAILWHRSDDEHAVLIDGVESPANVHIRMDLGQRLPLFVGAMGRCFAAHEGLGREALRERFSHLRWQTPLSFDDYEKGVEAVRRQGYAVDTGDFAQGVTIVSAPILGGDGRAVMAISLLGFSARLSGDALQRVAADLRQRTRMLSVTLAGADTLRENA